LVAHWRLNKSTNKKEESMQKLKKANEYTILKKRSGRYAVMDQSKKFIRGEEKVKVLLKEGLIKLTAPKAKEEPAAAAEA
jgi:bisphosphoglycerate-independent phosphoglycerate mutase (AlkP superfamily)